MLSETWRNCPKNEKPERLTGNTRLIRVQNLEEFRVSGFRVSRFGV